MSNRLTAIPIFTLLTLALLSTAVRSDLTDPREILSGHLTATLGENWREPRGGSYTRGYLEVLGTGLKGTLTRWHLPPLQERTEVDLGILKQVQGDDGDSAWITDPNGQLTVRKDARTLLERKVRAGLANHEYLDPASRRFSIRLTGIEPVAESDCYVVEIANTINGDLITRYIDTGSLLLLREIDRTPDERETIDFSDYREVAGEMIPFRQEIEVAPVGQRLLIVIDEYRSNIEIDPLLFEPPSTEPEDFRFTNGGDQVEIPFRFIENHIYLPVEIRGEEHLWVLDSGASSSVIDLEYAGELGLELKGELKGMGIGNPVEVSLVTTPPLSLPGVELASQNIVTLGLRELFSKALDLDIRGILGYDFLSRFVTRIDFSNRQLTLHRPATFRYKGSGEVVDCPLSDNFFTPPVTVDGQEAGLWNLDLGASGLTFHYPFARKRNFQERRGVEVVSLGAGGSLAEIRVPFESIEFAGFKLDNPVISVPLDRGQGVLSSSELGGNLGNDLLRHFTLYLDYKRQQLIVEKGGDFDTRFPRDKSGLQVLLNPAGRLEVFNVAQGTPAHKGGFERGDLIEKINGIDVEHLSGICAFRDLLRGESGTRFKILVDRNREREELKLTLKALY